MNEKDFSKPTLPEKQAEANAVDEKPRWTDQDAEKHPGASQEATTGALQLGRAL